MASQIESSQPNCYAAIIITFVAATVFVGLRVYARRLMSSRLELSDVLCFVAYLFAAACAGITLLLTSYGLGMLFSEIPGNDAATRSKTIMYGFILEFTYAYSLGLSKLSILSLYWRVFGLFCVRIPILVLTGATILWMICRTFIGLFHCFPVQAYWDKSIEDAVCPYDDSNYLFGTVLAHVVLDVAIFSLPIFQLQQMRFRTLSERLSILAMFASGFFICIISVINLTHLYKLLYIEENPEILWNMASPIIWSETEVNMAIVVISLPLMRPVATKAYRALFPTRAAAAARHHSALLWGAKQPAWVRFDSRDWLRKLTSGTGSDERTLLEGWDKSSAGSSDVSPVPEAHVLDAMPVLDSRERDERYGRRVTAGEFGLRVVSADYHDWMTAAGGRTDDRPATWSPV